MKNITTQSWIIPGNPKYYDIDGAFKNLEVLDWKQSNKNVKEGDIIYIYVSGHKIKYKCVVLKANKKEITIDDTPYQIVPSVYVGSELHMEIKLLATNKGRNLDIHDLRNNGVKGNIMGPRRIEGEVVDYIELIFSKDCE